MKIYIVSEVNLDYDDYPIGSPSRLLVTANEERAVALLNEPGWANYGSKRHASGYKYNRRASRSVDEVEVEDA